MNWKPGSRGPFTLDGNHDMYGWGSGYFELALRHATFAVQKATSYFSLALGKAPDVWYWGHEHVGTVYSRSSVAGPETLCRCMGHGGIPLAVSNELQEHTGEGKPIECFAHTPYPYDDPEYRGRVMNGFAAVTLTKDGGISERFLNQDGTDMCG